MKVAIFSDIHGSVEALELIKKNIIPNIDEVWFLGDLYFDYKNNEDTPKNRKVLYSWFKENFNQKLTVVISGNCDLKENSENEFFKETKIIKELLGKKILIEHGHEVKDAKEYLLSQDCDILITGHTHVGEITVIEDKLLLNPGSVSFPRDESNIPSYLLLDEENNNISLLSVDDNELIQELLLY